MPRYESTWVQLDKTPVSPSISVRYPSCVIVILCSAFCCFVYGIMAMSVFKSIKFGASLALSDKVKFAFN